VGPKDRWDGPKDEPRLTYSFVEWSHADRFGHNGVQLFLMALAWWGQDLWNHGAADGLGGGERALAAAADWHMLLKELDWFLLYAANDRDGEEKEAAEREVAAKPKPKKKGLTKR
jgi:hypothetical protein